MGTSMPALFTTTTFLTLGVFEVASSTLGLRGSGLPRLKNPSVVTTTLDSASRMRLFKPPAENPENTTEWMAPILAQASMAMGVSGIMGM
ncbi:MAG: hypothetical protein A4E46_00795 [Methanosaeta sp. PtaU1.Bin016]|nr:MAG: hypothetical protein A4E46_00795 [Methanosaeta sp. PtaU1.Bin016]